jgi:endonuclease/exonuclease/phosphatase family metal-dependent hydrolase
MDSRTIKIASLNLWRYKDWENRKQKIIDLVSKINPDVLFLQESDRDLSKDPECQAEILNRQLKFPHKIFAPSEIEPLEYGLAVLSKIPFTSKQIKLTQAPDDKHPRTILVCEFDLDDRKVSITNVHFSNRDDWSESHLKETLGIVNPESVLIGDFNIKDMTAYRELYSDKYTASSDTYKYISYPEDGLSYDYILLPNSMGFVSFECREETVSDHRMIVAEIRPCER